jgi:hypothetical protein
MAWAAGAAAAWQGLSQAGEEMRRCMPLLESLVLQ